MAEMIASGAAGLIAVFVTVLLSVWVRLRLQKSPTAEQGFGDQMSDLAKSLTDSSTEIDELILRITAVTSERELAVRSLERELADLESREQQAKERVDALENIPVAVADHFADLLTTREKRDARRDYFLFIGGAVFTTIIALVIQIFV